MLLLILFVMDVFVVGTVSLETSSTAAVSLGCVDGRDDGGIVGFEVYLAVTACEDNVISDGETTFDSLMPFAFAVGKKIMISFYC